jgi:hypothetical protein
MPSSIDRVNHHFGQQRKGVAGIKHSGELSRALRAIRAACGQAHVLPVDGYTMHVEKRLPVGSGGVRRARHRQLGLGEHGLVARKDLADGELARVRVVRVV